MSSPNAVDRIVDSYVSGRRVANHHLASTQDSALPTPMHITEEEEAYITWGTDGGQNLD